MKSKIFIVMVVTLAILLFKYSEKPQVISKTVPAQSPTASPTPTPSPIYTTAPTIKPTISSTQKPTPAQVMSSQNSWIFDLGTTRVITDTANDGDCPNNCPVINLQSFVTRNGGIFGVNGTYFCPVSYPECWSKSNSFDFPVYNTRLNHWINGGNLFWNSRSMIYFDGSGGHYKQNANSFSGALSAGMVNHPGLLDGGNIQIDENQSGLSDKQKSRGTKVGIGLIDSKKVIVMIGRNVNMREFALEFKKAGATDALNLDTGGSTAVFSNGKYVYGPGRDIPNAIIFVNK